jgi:HAD superfamily hydrolase (TIGR01509 family)
MYTTILFDFFGVIHENPMAKWQTQFGLTGDERCEVAAQQFDLQQTDYTGYLAMLAAASGQSPASIDAHFATALVNQETVALIRDLRPQFRIGLISNANAEELRPILKRNGLYQLFDSVTISSEVGSAKPDPAIFRHSLQALHVEPESAIFADDTAANIIASKSLGIEGVVFKNAAQARRELDVLLLGALGKGGMTCAE